MKQHLRYDHNRSKEDMIQLMDAENLEYYKQGNPNLVKGVLDGAVMIRKVEERNVTMVTQNAENGKIPDEGEKNEETSPAPEKEISNLEATEIAGEPEEKFTGLQDKFREIAQEIQQQSKAEEPKCGYGVVIENLIREEEAAAVLEAQICEHFTPEILKDEKMLSVFLGMIDGYITHAQHHRRFAQDLIKKVKENGHV